MENIKNLKEKAKKLPKKPGIYFFKDESGSVLYIGKAINLRNRVKSYFLKSSLLQPKTLSMVSRAKDISFIEVENELEALVLEAQNIKRIKPKYNSVLKDGKSYNYIYVLDINSCEERALKTLRLDRRKKDTGTCYGPFFNLKEIRSALKFLRKTFPYADCTETKYRTYKKIGRPCIYGKINLCFSPCQEGCVLKNNENIDRIVKFIESGKGPVLRDLTAQMSASSKNMRYEDAAYFRDLINMFERALRKFRLARDYDTNPNLIEDRRRIRVEALMSVLGLKKPLSRIEFYDVSNLAGNFATASMVVILNGSADKSQYRRFKIRYSKRRDDFEMIYETLKRRLKNEWVYPDLIVVDGGKGQVSLGLKALADSNININIPLIGIAKRDEVIITQDFREIKLSRNHPGLNLLQEGRDEAHRVALQYHKYLRNKGMFSGIEK